MSSKKDQKIFIYRRGKKIYDVYAADKTEAVAAFKTFRNMGTVLESAVREVTAKELEQLHEES